jgi:hypothetical protein
VFASRSLAEHFLRGAVGIGAFAAAAVFAERGWPILLLLPVALLALRGCPMCWTLGLIETLAAHLQRRPAREGCIGGACSGSRRVDASAAPRTKKLIG